MIAAAGSRNYKRKLTDLGGTTVALLALLIALIPLGALMAYVLKRGAGSLTPDFFTKGPPVMGQMGGGMYPMIIGTLIIVSLTSAIGIPIGLLSGIYLARVSNRFAHVVRFIADVVSGTPSILAGVIAYALIVIPTQNRSALAAALALAMLMFPTVTRATEVAIRGVPSEIREAALALGSPEWKTMLTVLLPTAASGIVTAIILGIARVAGETAPLVFTAGGNNFLNLDIFHGFFPALPLQIWVDAQSPYPADRQAALAGAFVLFALVVVLNLLARGLTFRLARRTRIA